MYFYPSLCIALLIFVNSLIQQTPSKSPESDDIRELTRLENVWNEAHVRGDGEVLDGLWADDFVVTVPNMPFMTKADTIGIWRSGKMKFQRYQTSDIRIR